MAPSGPRLSLRSVLGMRCSWPAFAPGPWLCSRWWRSVLPVPDLNPDSLRQVSNLQLPKANLCPPTTARPPLQFGVSVNKVLLEYSRLFICVLSVVVFRLRGQRSWVAVTETTWQQTLSCPLPGAVQSVFAAPPLRKWWSCRPSVSQLPLQPQNDGGQASLQTSLSCWAAPGAPFL